MRKEVLPVIRSIPLLLLAAVTACGSPNLPEKEEGVELGGNLGRVGDVSVSADEYRAYVADSGRKLSDLEPAVRREMLSRLLARKSLAAEALRQGIDRDPDFQKAFSRWKIEAYPEFFWNEHVLSGIEYTREELWNYVDPADEFRVSAIILPDDDEGELAREVHGLLVAGGDFAELAREHSTGFLRDKGGAMGWITFPNKFVPAEAEAELQKLQPGEFTPPLPTMVGTVIYLLNGHRTAEEIFEQERESAIQPVKMAKFNTEVERLAKEIRSRATVVYPDQEPGAPAAIVDGFEIRLPVKQEEVHDFSYRDIETKDKGLEKFIGAFLVAREVERLGLDKKPPLSWRVALARIERLAGVLIRRSVEPRVVVTEEEMRAEYDRFYQEDVYTLQLIQTLKREDAEKALGLLEEGEDFSQVSKDLSFGRIRISGGYLAEMPLSDYPEDVRATIRGLADGERTGIVAMGDTFNIFKRLSSRIIEVPDFEELKDRIRGTLALKKRADLTRAFVEDFGRDMEMLIDEKRLAELK